MIVDRMIDGDAVVLTWSVLHPLRGRRDRGTGNAGVVTAPSIVEKVPTL